MATPLARAITGLILTSILVVGCSKADSAEDPPGQAPTGSSDAVDGAVGSETCPLDREQLSFVVRDWGRVFGSIGRGDHSTYTGALATKLDKTQDAAGGCNGSAELARFLAAVRRIDARSRRPTPVYALYDAASRSGNSWLTKVGYGNNALSVG